MNQRLAGLTERRERLVARAAAQRAALAADVAPWRAPLALADQGLVALRFLKRNPLWLAGGVALVAVLRPRQAGKWLRRGWLAWRFVSKVRGR